MSKLGDLFAEWKRDPEYQREERRQGWWLDLQISLYKIRKAIAARFTPPAEISDDFGQFWPSRCPDCGAEMVVERPGRATCSAECWITPDEGGGESRKED